MRNAYAIKISSATAPADKIELAKGQTQPSIIKVGGNSKVELIDVANGAAPPIAVKRVGKDLHVALEGDDPATPDLILQDFYGDGESHLVGMAEGGQYLDYVPTAGNREFQVALLADGSDAGLQMSGGAGVSGVSASVATAEFSLPMVVLGGLAALGTAAAVSGSGGGHESVAPTASTPTPTATPTQRPDGYLDSTHPEQNQQSKSAVTGDNTPGLHIGPLPVGVTSAVLYVDGMVRSATYNPVDGTLTPDIPLLDGTHALGYGLTDSLGTTPSSPTLTVTVDTTAPAGPKLHVADTDGDGRPNVTGTGEAGGTVTVTDPGGVKHTTTVDSRGNFGLMIDRLATPNGIWTATVTDVVGNVSTAGMANEVDLAPPAVPRLAVFDDVGDVQGVVPEHGVTNDTMPMLKGTAEAGSLVTVMIEGKVVATAIADASSNWSFTPDKMPDGTYSVTVRATDVAGNVGFESPASIFTIDTAAPLAAISGNATDDVGVLQGSIVAGMKTDDATPTFSGQAEAGAIVSVMDGAAFLGTTLVDPTGNWTFTSPSLVDGAHSFTASVVGIYVGDIQNGLSTNDATPLLSGTAEANRLIGLYDGSVLIGTTMTDASGNWKFTPTLVGEGTHAMTVNSTDAAGNVSSTSSIWTVQVDTKLPDPATIGGSNDDFGLDTGSISSGASTNDTTPQMSGTAEASSLISLYDGDVLKGTTVTDPSGNWAYTPSLVGDGAHAMTVTTTDAAGNTSSASNTWAVQLDTKMPDAPIIQAANDDVDLHIGNIASGVATNDATPLVSGTAEANSLIRLYDNGEFYGSTTANASGSWWFTPSLVGDGAHTITVTATDAAGNISVPSGNWIVAIDTVAPVFTGNASVGMSLKETSAAGTVLHDATADGDAVSYSLTGADSSRFAVDSIGRVSLNFAPDYEAPTDTDANNIYDVTIDAMDMAGNVSSQDLHVTVSNLLEPGITRVITGPGIGAGGVPANTLMMDFTADTAVTWSMNSQPNGLRIDQNGQVWTARIFNPNNSENPFSLTVTALASDGSYTSYAETFGWGFSVGFFPPPTITHGFVPIMLDLNLDGDISYANTQVDARGDGSMMTTAWAAPEDGVLVWDKYHDGQVHDSSQFAFSQYLAGAKTDLEGLRAFDTSGNGQLDVADVLWSQMRVWQDVNGDGASNSGEVKTLADWKIASIDLTSDGIASSPATGVHGSGRTVATLENGTRMVVADVAIEATVSADSNTAASASIAVAQAFTESALPDLSYLQSYQMQTHAVI